MQSLAIKAKMRRCAQFIVDNRETARRDAAVMNTAKESARVKHQVTSNTVRREAWCRVQHRTTVQFIAWIDSRACQCQFTRLQAS